MLINKCFKISSKNFLRKNSSKFFTEKNSDILYTKPKYYANINSVIPPEIYSEKYKLTFG